MGLCKKFDKYHVCCTTIIIIFLFNHQMTRNWANVLCLSSFIMNMWDFSVTQQQEQDKRVLGVHMTSRKYALLWATTFYIIFVFIFVFAFDKQKSERQLCHCVQPPFTLSKVHNEGGRGYLSGQIYIFLICFT